MYRQLLFALTAYGLEFLIQKKKMKNYCQRKKPMKKTSNTGENSIYHSYKNLVSLKEKENTFKEECQKNTNLLIPEWAKTLIELYTSPLKYRLGMN